jgi:hypothetical protein
VTPGPAAAVVAAAVLWVGVLAAVDAAVELLLLELPQPANSATAEAAVAARPRERVTCLLLVVGSLA